MYSLCHSVGEVYLAHPDLLFLFTFPRSKLVVHVINSDRFVVSASALKVNYKPSQLLKINGIDH